MPKAIFKKWSPDPHKVKKNPALKFLGVLLHDPHLFHLNRHSISVAFFVGLFVTFLPIPGQIPLAAVGAFVFRCNLPIAVSLVLISNPITMPFIFYAAYKVGVDLLNLQQQHLDFEISWAWFQNDFIKIWKPLLLGSIIGSFFFSCFGFLAVQWSWRWHVVKRWNQRKLRRQKKTD